MKIRNWQKRLAAQLTIKPVMLGQNAMSINYGYGNQFIVIRDRAKQLYKVIEGWPLSCPEYVSTCLDLDEVLDRVS